jgi:hypothetical protein
MFRGKMLALLKAAHGQDRLQFFGPYTELADKAAFKTFLEPLYRKASCCRAGRGKRRGPEPTKARGGKSAPSGPTSTSRTSVLRVA